MESEEKADDDQDQESDDSDHQDVQVEDSPEHLNIHVMIHHNDVNIEPPNFWCFFGP